jgi:hypothetical protein
MRVNGAERGKVVRSRKGSKGRTEILTRTEILARTFNFNEQLVPRFIGA